MSSIFILTKLMFLLCLIHIVSANSSYEYGFGIGGGVGGLIIFILDIYAIIKILQSSRDAFGKLLWILLIIFFPIGGFIVWLLCGRQSSAVN